MFILSNLLKRYRRYRQLKSLGCYMTKGYKYGFTPETLNVCGINKDNYRDYLSDIDYAMGHPYNGTYTSIIDNKLYLPLLFHNYKEYIPEYYFFIDNGKLLPLEDSELYKTSPRVDVSEFFRILSDKHKLVLKHTHMSVGKGFMLIEQENDKFYVNKKEIDAENLRNLIESLNHYIVTEFVYQHKYSSDICETSLNTLRFLCIWDDEKNQFFLARAFHRFGCNGNVVDNIGSGNGILVFVDVEKGELTGKGAINFNHTGDKYRENIVHPDHNVSLKGIKIPNFDTVKSKILEIANANSYLKYIGFDVAITNDGFKIIETNSLSSLDVVQQREGFLKDERIRRVLKK